MDKPRTGMPGVPTLTKKDVADFTVSPDVARVVKTPADPEQFNPKVNQDPIEKARSYAAQARERAEARAGGSSLKGRAPPLGHAPAPSHEKMAAIAKLHGAAAPAELEPPTEKKPTPPIMSGVGSAYPINQALAQGKTDGPVSIKEASTMQPDKPALSKETVEALRQANDNVRRGMPQPQAPSEVPSVAEEVKQGIEDASKDLAPDAQPPDIDFQAMSDVRNALMTEDRRKSIEARLGELDIGEMIMKRELQQLVTIIPDKLEVRLRTYSQRENLWILKYIYDFPGSVLYTQELINTCRLVCCLVSVNGALFPDHRKNLGQVNEEIDKESFEKKLAHVVSMPVQLVADFSVQSLWFQDRVEKLFTVDALKNG